MGIENLIPGMTQAKLVVGIIGLAAVAVPSAGWYITAHTLHGVREWQGEVVTSTTAAAHARLPIAVKDVPDQIEKLGDALDKVETVSAGVVQKNATNNARIETAQDQVTEKTSHDIDTQIAAARAAGAADYARRMRGASGGAGNQGGASQPPAGQAGNGTQVADRADGVPVMDEADVRICSDNTIKALNWQGFWFGLAAIPQTVPDQPGS